MIGPIQIPQGVVSQGSKRAAWRSRKLLAAFDCQWPTLGEVCLAGHVWEAYTYLPVLCV